jgi:hypothetical protein
MEAWPTARQLPERQAVTSQATHSLRFGLNSGPTGLLFPTPAAPLQHRHWVHARLPDQTLKLEPPLLESGPELTMLCTSRRVAEWLGT